MLDIDHGAYPYVTWSSSSRERIFSGTGMGPGNLEAVLGINKGYTTRVGADPFSSGSPAISLIRCAKKATNSAATPGVRGVSGGSTPCSPVTPLASTGCGRSRLPSSTF